MPLSATRAHRQRLRGHGGATAADDPARHRRSRATRCRRERDLAARFSVSRDTVREAIRSARGRRLPRLAPRSLRRHLRQRDPADARRLDPVPPSAPRLDDVLGAARDPRGRRGARRGRTRRSSPPSATCSGAASRRRRPRQPARLPASRLATAPDHRRARWRAVARVAHRRQPIARQRRCSTASRCWRRTSSTRTSSTRRSSWRSCAGNPERAEAAMAEHLEGSAALLRGFLR